MISTDVIPDLLKRTPSLGLVIAVMGCVSCGNQADSEQEPKRFVYKEAPTPIISQVPPEMSGLLDMLGDLRGKIGDFETKLLEASAVHRQMAFDDLLTADLSEMGNDELSYLWHFADKGYFTVEREIMIRILEDRQSRDPVDNLPSGNITQRAEILAERYKAKLHELSLALEMYDKRGQEEFTIPQNLTAEQTDILRTMVREQLDRIGQQCATLDAKIKELQPPKS